MRWNLLLLTVIGLVLSGIAPAIAGQQGTHAETADVFGQGPNGPVVAIDGATLRRTDNSIQAKIRMPRPEQDTYTYPDPDDPTAAEPGNPEGFTLWVFVFDEELGPFADHPWSSAFFAAGHLVGGTELTLSGQINLNTEPFAGFHLENPRDAEIHLAVAPHGALDPDIMPEQIKTPAGDPSMWWFAIFD